MHLQPGCTVGHHSPPAGELGKGGEGKGGGQREVAASIKGKKMRGRDLWRRISSMAQGREGDVPGQAA